MFDYPGERLQNWASWLFIIETVALFVGTIILVTQVWALRELGLLWFLLIFSVGTAGNYVISLVLYGFGKMVENSTETVGYVKRLADDQRKENTTPEESTTQVKYPTSQDNSGTSSVKETNEIVVEQKDFVGDVSIVCPVCGSKQLANRKVCWQCGVKFVNE